MENYLQQLDKINQYLDLIAYEVTNKDELIDMMVAGGPPKTMREQLQQLITPTKGE